MSLENRSEAYRRYLSVGISFVLVSSALSLVVVGGPVVGAGSSSGIALDGSASNGCGYVTTCNISLTTTQSNDVIIVGCDCWPSGTTFSVKDMAGLTFIPRESQLGIGGNQLMQTWYAISTSPISSDAISVTTTRTGETWYGIVVFAVSGANTVNPFVSGFPESQANLKCTDPCNTGVSAPAGAFVLQIGGDTGYMLQTAGTGMTLIQTTRAGQDVYAQYEVPSSALSSATLSFGTPQGSDFGVIVDVINPAPSMTTSSSTSTTNGMMIDGTVQHKCTGLIASGICTTTFDTSNSPDVIYICVGSGTGGEVSSFPVSGAGLTWTVRDSRFVASETSISCSYAIASEALSNAKIAVTDNGPSGVNLYVAIWGIYGANTGSPFGSGEVCLNYGSFTTAAASVGCTVSTSSPVSMLISFTFDENGGLTYGSCAGYNELGFVTNDGYSQYQIVSATQSSTNVCVNLSGNSGTTYWSEVADAIDGPSSTSTSTSSTSTSASYSPTPLAITGKASATSTNSTVDTISQFSTTSDNELVVLYATVDSYTSGACPPVNTVASVAGGSLTWYHRASATVCSDPTPPYYHYLDEEEWYAIAPTPLSGATITITSTDHPVSNIDGIDGTALGITGANTVSPFDSDSVLPCESSGTMTSNPQPSCSVSTSKANDLVIGGAALEDGITYVYMYKVSPFALLAPASPAACNNSAACWAVEYNTYSSPQSNLNVPFCTSTSEASCSPVSDSLWAEVADAVQAAL